MRPIKQMLFIGCVVGLAACVSDPPTAVEPDAGGSNVVTNQDVGFGFARDSGETGDRDAGTDAGEPDAGEEPDGGPDDAGPDLSRVKWGQRIATENLGPAHSEELSCPQDTFVIGMNLTYSLAGENTVPERYITGLRIVCGEWTYESGQFTHQPGGGDGPLLTAGTVGESGMTRCGTRIATGFPIRKFVDNTIVREVALDCGSVELLDGEPVTSDPRRSTFFLDGGCEDTAKALGGVNQPTECEEAVLGCPAGLGLTGIRLRPDNYVFLGVEIVCRDLVLGAP